MSGESLAVLLSKLNSCEEAADIMYSTDAAQTLNGSAASSALPASVNSTAASANREEISVIVARRIDTMVARLNDLASPASQVVLTPRMVLCELMDILRQALFTSLPVEMQSAVALTDKAGVVRQFNAYVSAWQVPVTAAAEALHTVSYVSVKLRVELVALQLRRRVQAELQKKDTQASEESVAALVVTETLLDDLMAIYNNIVLTLPVTKAAGAVGGSAADSVAVAAAVERLVPVFEHYFYQLCDWVLVLESTMQGPVMSYTQVKRLTADEQRGTAVVDLHRPTAQTAWGLLLNERGCLVDIDVSLRVFDKAKQLHRLLQAAPQGAQIIKINDKPIPGARTSSSSSGTADGSAHAQAVVAALQAATASRKNVQLTLQSPAFKSAARTMATEVAFVAPPQGGEGTAGQRVTLVLRRQSTTAVWGFSVDDRLYWHHPPLRILSEPAKAFIKDYGRHLRLLAVNGVEALHPSQVKLLVAAAETVVLELLVMPSFTESRRAAAPASSPPSAPPAAIDSGAVKNAAVAAAPKVKRGSDNAAGDAWMEAAVAKLLKGQASESATTAVGTSGGTVDADHPSSKDPASSLAASPAVAVSEGLAPAVAEAAVALETPLVDAVMHRPSPTAAAGVATVAKRGRPPKTVATNDAAAAAAAAPVSSPTAEASSKEGKRGRPRKTSPQESSAASVGEEAQLRKSVEAVAEPEDSSTSSPSASLTRKNKKSIGTSDAAACVFDNKVRLLQLSEAEMVLERPTTDMPWGLPIGRISDTAASPQQLPLRLMSLPPAKSSSSKAHPFLTQFKKEPATWFIAEVNGKPATNAETTLKAIGKLTRMTLRFVRK